MFSCALNYMHAHFQAYLTNSDTVNSEMTVMDKMIKIQKSILLVPTFIPISPCKTTLISSYSLQPFRSQPPPLQLSRLPRQADAPCDGTPAWKGSRAGVKSICQHLVGHTLFILRSKWCPWLPTTSTTNRLPHCSSTSSTPNRYQALRAENTPGKKEKNSNS